MPVPDETKNSAGGAPEGPPRSMRLALAGAVVLVVAGGAAFYFATQANHGAAKAGAYRVAVTEQACEPNDITVPAGRQTFEIVNKSDRPVEWEILDGVMVVEERENIAPGFKQTFSATLKAGDYAITCGLLSNPRGTLRVTPSKTAGTQTAQPTLRAFIGPLSEYKVYLALQGAAMVKAVQQLADAVKAGDLEKARSLYEPARLPYKRIEAVASRFADLENVIDPVADYLEKREQDSAFSGFHRIEYGLFEKNSTDGLTPVASRLVADIGELKTRLRALKLEPALLADSAAGLAEQLAQGRLTRGENQYAHTDLADIDANLDGIAKIVGLLIPIVRPSAPDVAKDVYDKLDTARDAVTTLRKEKGAASYDEVDEAARKALAAKFADLAASLRKLNPAIGIS